MARFNVEKQADKLSEALQTMNDQVSGFAQRARRTIDTLEAELSVARYPGLHLESLLRPLCGQVVAHQITWCHDDLFLLGACPWPTNAMGEFLEDLGFTISREITPETTVVIGAYELEDANFEALLHFGAEQELQIFPQELFILGLIRNVDPFDLLGDQQIEAIAEGNPAIRELLEHGITWPVWISTEQSLDVPTVELISDDRGEGESGALETSEWSDQSVLGKIGYSVREGFLTVKQRRAYMETALTHDLSDVASPNDIAKWGAPRTTGRLQAIVSFVVWLNRTQSADKQAARQKRLEDLAWLQERYDPRKTRVKWPALDFQQPEPASRTRKAAFTKLLKPSPQLAAIVGTTPQSRSEIVAALWSYIQRNRLQDSVNKRNVFADDKLKAIFGGKQQVTMFELAGLIGKHVT